MNISFNEVHSQVIEILKEAESKFRKAFFGKTQVMQKEGVQLSTVILTQTDQELDSFLQRELKIRFPNFGFISEEEEKKQTLKEHNWIIDPIDGTANFAHKIPICGISIALWEKDNPLYGIVSFPILCETLHAYSDKGLFLNGQRVYKIETQKGPFPYLTLNHVGKNKERIAIYSAITKVAPPLNYSCATYQGCLTVLGRTDAWIAVNLPIWDIAAVLLFAKETNLLCEFISRPPALSDPDIRAYKNSFVIGDRELAIKISAQIKKGLKKTK